MKKWLALMLALVMCLALFAGCGETTEEESTATDTEEATESGETEEATEEATEAAGSVYYLNFKPEQAEQWEALSAQYSEATGVDVQVQTAASGTYEQTLKSEMAKDNAPTLFQVNGPVGLASWMDYCYDLSESDIFGELKSDDFALKDGDAVYGIGYVIETYGLIYNKTKLAEYCALDNAVIADASEITSFDTLKAVAEDIQSRKDELGVMGAFASAGLDSSSDWRFKTHLANLPIYYEYKADGIGTTEEIKGTYLDNYKAIFDLYINNATCEPSMLSAKTMDDSTAEFAMGEAVFYQNGTWAYGDIKNAETLGDDEIGMLPIFIGAEGEENQGLCTGTENYWCVNKNASEDDVNATLDFMNWCMTSDEGKAGMMEMGFVCPFNGFTAEFLPQNPLVTAADDYIADGKTAVAWCFPTMPSEEWKNGVGAALLEYAQGTGDWAAVETAFVDGWAAEYAAKAA